MRRKHRAIKGQRRNIRGVKEETNAQGSEDWRKKNGL
jgi:hypothetical protein